MSTSAYKTVVLGGGNSAGYAAWEWIKRGGGEGLAIIGDEPVVAYERPALSKAYLFPEKPARLPGFHTTVGGGGQKQEMTWYKENNIEFRTGVHVSEADITKKQLTTADGQSITYEKLIIATGARPISLADFKTPGADLKGIYYLRNVVDADRIIAALPEAKERGGRAVIVGGGYIGLETAAGLSMNGLDVTLVFPESRVMERLFTPEIASFYEKFYEDKGIKFIKGTTVTAFEGEGDKVKTSVLKDGTKLESDIVLVGVGARPNIELFKGQLDMLEERPGGIKVDGHLRTSVPNVYAVGDVAAFPLKRYGNTTRQEHVTNCRTSAQHAVASILAPDSVDEYDYLPFFYSRVFNLSWQFYGVNEGTPIFFGSKEEGKFGTYWVKDGKVVGAFLESGSGEENAAIKKVADLRPDAPSNLESEGLAFASKL
ncbi:hypothetical protein WJX81_005619 [Elliptochloris bilobata]|uniref:monodehydroascorbate reductase (NADH) n=1 Tax=Elliptochloris bilobata TaxID=381761 RepID=A0AAW1RJA4_9CHLO